MKALTYIPLSGALVLMLSGCGSLSGLDAKNSFSCKAPDGVLCGSMTGVYANAKANNLPGQRGSVKADKDGAEVSRAKGQESGSGVLTKPIYSGTPIRTAPLVLRVWFAPWEDTDGDLHDQSYVYLPVDNGRWLIEHNRRRIQDAYRPVRAPTAPTAQMAGSTGGVQGKMKVVPPAEPENTGGEKPEVAQTPEQMLNGILRPGLPGSPAQTGDTQ